MGVGRPGVKLIEVDVTKDWLIVEYDASKVSVADMQRTIEQQKFTGTVVKTP
jgi:hypothetical protein